MNRSTLLMAFGGAVLIFLPLILALALVPSGKSDSGTEGDELNALNGTLINVLSDSEDNMTESNVTDLSRGDFFEPISIDENETTTASGDEDNEISIDENATTTTDEEEEEKSADENNETEVEEGLKLVPDIDVKPDGVIQPDQVTPVEIQAPSDEGKTDIDVDPDIVVQSGSIPSAQAVPVTDNSGTTSNLRGAAPAKTDANEITINTARSVAPPVTNSEEDFKTLRYLALGTSLTWGAKLANRTTDAYVSYLSPHAVNMGLRVTSADYPALCAYSMIGEAQYDVIILEFYQLRAKKLNMLARRLKQRFPDAWIIFLEIWTPYQFKHIPTGLNMKQWELAHNFTSHTKDHRFLVYFMQNTLPTEWSFDSKPYAHDIEMDAISAIQGHFVNVREPGNAHKAMLEFGPYYHDDMIHLTKVGHEHVANYIRNELRHWNFRDRKNIVNPWTDKDSCHLWYDNGKDELEHDPGTRMVEFETGKFALEIPPQGGWIKLNNPLDKAAQVYIKYMTAGPVQLYPKTAFRFSGNDDNKVEALIEPIVPRAHHEVIVANHLSAIGHIRQGTSVMFVTPQEESVLPFRILGILITTPEDQIQLHSFHAKTPGVQQVSI